MEIPSSRPNLGRQGALLAFGIRLVTSLSRGVTLTLAPASKSQGLRCGACDLLLSSFNAGLATEGTRRVEMGMR